MIKKEKIIENIKKNKVGLIICGVIFVGLLLLNLCKLITNNMTDKQKESNHNVITLELEHRNYEIKNRISNTYASNPSVIYLDIPNNLERYSNITNIPSGTWFSYFSINPTDNSGIRWTNVYQNVYHLEYVVKGAVLDYVTYTYVGGQNYTWNIGVIDNVTNDLIEIGFKSIMNVNLVEEKRDIDNPEIVVNSLEYYDFFINSFLLDIDFNYICDLSFSTETDIQLYQLNNSQLIYLMNNYNTDNQLTTIDNYIPYKINENIDSEYYDYYNNGYNEGFSSGYGVGSSEGANNVVNNPNNYGLYNQTQYDNNYTNGANSVINNPNNYGLYNQTQYDDNYDLGYITAENEVTPDLATNGFKTMFNSILNAPLNIFGGLLNFEFFGINVFNLFSFLFTLVLIGFVIKLLI